MIVDDEEYEPMIRKNSKSVSEEIQSLQNELNLVTDRNFIYGDQTPVIFSKTIHC